MDSLFDMLLTEPVAAQPLDDVDAAWTRLRSAAKRFDRQLDRAIAGGFVADRLGFAFLSGYQAALRTLIPDLPEDELVAICVSEQGGVHPSAIRATLARQQGVWLVNGTKSFVIASASASRLVVIASVGTGADGRNRLRATMVDPNAPGVDLTEHPPASFIPEVPHASVRLTDVPVRVLPGDGYADYAKPFRTIEDIHVLAAALGWLTRVARVSDWPSAIRQRLLAALAAVRGLGSDSPSSPGVHIALSGVVDVIDDLLTEVEPLWASVDSTIRSRWERDRRLLAIAGSVRGQRLGAAWSAVGTATG